MTVRHVLVDFDGVVIKNRAYQKIVEKRIIQYVARSYNIKNMKEAKILNTFLYKKYGHTYWGMNELPPSGTKRITLDDFNKTVYSHDIKKEILMSTNYNIYQDDIDKWEAFCIMLSMSSLDVSIFSNAPKQWCDFFTKPINNKYNVSNLHDVFPVSMEMLKPKPEVYQYIDQNIIKHKPVVFIDDSVMNLSYPMQLSNWTNILFDPQNEQTIQKINDNLYIASDLSKCYDIITYI